MVLIHLLRLRTIVKKGQSLGNIVARIDKRQCSDLFPQIYCIILLRRYFFSIRKICDWVILKDFLRTMKIGWSYIDHSSVYVLPLCYSKISMRIPTAGKNINCVKSLFVMFAFKDSDIPKEKEWERQYPDQTIWKKNLHWKWLEDHWVQFWFWIENLCLTWKHIWICLSTSRVIFRLIADLLPLVCIRDSWLRTNVVERETMLMMSKFTFLGNKKLILIQ